MATKKSLIDFDVDDAYAYVILRTHRLLRWHFLRGMKTLGIDMTQEQFVMLNKLSHRDGCPQGELVNATFNDRANVSRIVVGLERRGWIQREPDPVDGRGIRVYLSAEGRDVLMRIGEHVPESRSRIYAGLSSDDFMHLSRICSQIERNVLGVE